MDQHNSFHMLISNPTSNFDDENPYKNPTANYLKYLAYRHVDHVNRKDFSHPDFEKYFTPDYVAYLPHSQQPHSRNIKDFIDNYKAHAIAHPEYHVEALSVSVDVNEKDGTATVWMLLRITGQPTTVQRENVTVVYFRRKRGGNWVAYKQTGIRGINPA